MYKRSKTPRQCAPTDATASHNRSRPDIDVGFDEGEGVKHLTRNSLGTATLVYYDFPRLEAEARNAMERVQQLREVKRTLSMKDLLKYPSLNKWGDQKDKQEILNSKPGFPDPRKWAVSAMAKRLQKREETIKRYARGVGVRAAGTFHRKK